MAALLLKSATQYLPNYEQLLVNLKNATCLDVVLIGKVTGRSNFFSSGCVAPFSGINTCICLTPGASIHYFFFSRILALVNSLAASIKASSLSQLAAGSKAWLYDFLMAITSWLPVTAASVIK